MRSYGFPPGRVLARGPGESYGDVAACVLPDVLIEDNCESIGSDEITYPQIPAPARTRINSIVVAEFGGIDDLPDRVEDLRSWIAHGMTIAEEQAPRDSPERSISCHIVLTCYVRLTSCNYLENQPIATLPWCECCS